MSEYIISIFTIDGHSVYSLYLWKPVGDSWELLSGDPQQNSLIICKKSSLLLIFSTPNAI